MFNNKAKKAQALQTRITARKTARRIQTAKHVIGVYDWSNNNTDVKAV